jgi:hypothetical protein
MADHSKRTGPARLSGFGGSPTYTPAGPFFPFSKQERDNTELLLLHNSNNLFFGKPLALHRLDLQKARLQFNLA